MSHDLDRPFTPVEEMQFFKAADSETSRRYGAVVRACKITNREYKNRYAKFSESRAMKPPPGSVMHIYLGYLVVRKYGTPGQYETWIPDHAFEDMYDFFVPEP